MDGVSEEGMAVVAVCNGYIGHDVIGLSVIKVVVQNDLHVARGCRTF